MAKKIVTGMSNNRQELFEIINQLDATGIQRALIALRVIAKNRKDIAELMAAGMTEDQAAKHLIAEMVERDQQKVSG